MRAFRVLLSVALLAFAGCDRRPAAATTTAAEVSRGTPGRLFGPADARILALGDSYTIGESVEGSERFPSQLVKHLRERGMKGLPEAAVLARTGWTTEELLAGMDSAAFAKRYDCVTVLIGVNDQFRGGSAEAFRPELRRLLERATGLAGNDAQRVAVISIPDWGVTPMNEQMGRPGVTAEIDAFNAVCRKEAKTRGMAFVEITDVSRRVPGQLELIAADGLHPSAKQYGLWVERLAPVVEKILR